MSLGNVEKRAPTRWGPFFFFRQSSFCCIFCCPFWFSSPLFLVVSSLWAISPVVAFSSLTLDVVFFPSLRTSHARLLPFARFSPDNREMASQPATSCWKKRGKSSALGGTAANKRILPSRIGPAAARLYKLLTPWWLGAAEREVELTPLYLFTQTHTHWLAGYDNNSREERRRRERRQKFSSSSTFFSVFKWVIYLLLLLDFGKYRAVFPSVSLLFSTRFQ